MITETFYCSYMALNNISCSEDKIYEEQIPTRIKTWYSWHIAGLHPSLFAWEDQDDARGTVKECPQECLK